LDWASQLVLILGLLSALLLGGMWLPFAILATGLISIFLADGIAGFNALGFVLWGSMNSFTLTAIPLFILMSEILLQSGITGPLYAALARVARPIPGGLLQTNIASSALFAAICGSSVATAAAIGTVALPNLEKRGYSMRMAYGSLAAGGTLGILIPPSIPMILYGSFTETSVAKLFMAGVVPGILLATIFMIYIGIRSLLLADNAPQTDEGRIPLRTVIGQLLPFVFLMTTILGGIYFGWATPTEAAALGCTIAVLIGLFSGGLTRSVVTRSFVVAMRSSAAILAIVMAAMVFAYAFENASLGKNLTQWLLSLKLDRDTFLLALLILYVILGCLMESIAMMVITVPLLFPTIVAYGIDPIWFCVALVILIELGQLTPPFGINLFVIKQISGAPLGEVVRGTVPYYALIIGFVMLLNFVPGIALWLPNAMFSQ